MCFLPGMSRSSEVRRDSLDVVLLHACVYSICMYSLYVYSTHYHHLSTTYDHLSQFCTLYLRSSRFGQGLDEAKGFSGLTDQECGFTIGFSTSRPNLGAEREDDRARAEAKERQDKMKKTTRTTTTKMVRTWYRAKMGNGMEQEEEIQAKEMQHWLLARKSHSSTIKSPWQQPPQEDEWTD